MFDDFGDFDEDDLELDEPPTQCAKCGSKLVIRTGPHSRFLGCSNFPSCRGGTTFSLEDYPDFELPDELPSKVIKAAAKGKRPVSFTENRWKDYKLIRNADEWAKFVGAVSLKLARQVHGDCEPKVYPVLMCRVPAEPDWGPGASDGFVVINKNEARQLLAKFNVPVKLETKKKP